MTNVFQPTCPKCQGSMIQGFIADIGYGMKYVSGWVQGPPEKSFWTGTKTPHTIPVGTFRCEACGFLESYAREEFQAD